MFSFFGRKTSHSPRESKKTPCYLFTTLNTVLHHTRYAFNVIVKLTIGSHFFTMAQADICFSKDNIYFTFVSSAEQTVFHFLKENCAVQHPNSSIFCPERSIFHGTNYGSSSLGLPTAIVCHYSPEPMNPCIDQTFYHHNPSGLGSSAEPWWDYAILSVVILVSVSIFRCGYKKLREMRDGDVTQNYQRNFFDESDSETVSNNNVDLDDLGYTLIDDETPSEVPPVAPVAETIVTIPPQISTPIVLPPQQDHLVISQKPLPKQDEDKFEMYRCPLSIHVMRDPYTASDGFTYERKDFLEILKYNNISPMNHNSVLSDKREEIIMHKGSKLIREQIHSAVLEHPSLAKEFYDCHQDAIESPNVELGEVDFAARFKEKYPELLRPQRGLRK